MHPESEVGAAVSSPWGPTEAQRAPAEAAVRGAGPGAEDAAAPGGQWAQTETAGGDEEGAVPHLTLEEQIDGGLEKEVSKM